MDPTTRAQMLAAVLRRDEPWPCATPSGIGDIGEDDYLAYEVEWAAA